MKSGDLLHTQMKFARGESAFGMIPQKYKILSVGFYIRKEKVFFQLTKLAQFILVRIISGLMSNPQSSTIQNPKHQ